MTIITQSSLTPPDDTTWSHTCCTLSDTTRSSLSLWCSSWANLHGDTFGDDAVQFQSEEMIHWSGAYHTVQHLQPSMPDTHQKLLKWHQAGRLLSDQVSPPAGIFNFVLSSSHLANAHMTLSNRTPPHLLREHLCNYTHPHEGECPVCLWGLELKKGLFLSV